VLHQPVTSHYFQLQPCWRGSSAMLAWLTTLTLLLKVSATVTDYGGQGRTLFFLPFSLFIMCAKIIRNNSLVEGGKAQAKP